MANSETVLKRSPFCLLLHSWRIILCFFTKALDKLLFVLYNDAVMGLNVVQEASWSCIYILFFAYAERKASEDHG